MNPIYGRDIEELGASSDEHEDFIRRRKLKRREVHWIHKFFDWDMHVNS
jgi:hypothetical protein